MTFKQLNFYTFHINTTSVDDGINTLSLEQDGVHLANDIFKCICLKKNF